MDDQSFSVANSDSSSSYTTNLRKRFFSFFPDKFTFLDKISGLYNRTPSIPRRRATCLPLPLPPQLTSEASKVHQVLRDILENIFFNLHCVQKNLHFWEERVKGSTSEKVRFMVLERGPWAFFDGSGQLMHDYVFLGTLGVQNFSSSASAHISERISVLTSLRYSLATFLAQVYVEVDKFGEDIKKEPEKSSALLLGAINDLFLNLEASIGHLSAIRQVCAFHFIPDTCYFKIDRKRSRYKFIKCLSYQLNLHFDMQYGSSVDGSYSSPLLFEKLPEINHEKSQWTDCEIRDAVNLIYVNLNKLDVYLSLLVAKHQKPRKITRHWMRYTLGVVGFSVFSLWLLRHSRLGGSSDIDNWILEAKSSITSFMIDHVEQPLIAIRDELFETFRKRHKGLMELEEVQLTSNSLHRMLLAFSEQTKGQKFPGNASDQEMLEIVMGRYEKELLHPIQNLLGGELARAMLIQIQKLKLDIETAMLALNQILKANEINFAILAALPAFFLSLLVLMLLRAWVKQDARAEGKGKIAREQRRKLILEVDNRIMEFQHCIDDGKEKDAQYIYGLVLYALDRLYRAAERHAKETKEWEQLSKDLCDLGKPNFKVSDKLRLTLRMPQMYACLDPSVHR